MDGYVSTVFTGGFGLELALHNTQETRDLIGWRFAMELAALALIGIGSGRIYPRHYLRPFFCGIFLFLLSLRPVNGMDMDMGIDRNGHRNRHGRRTALEHPGR